MEGLRGGPAVMLNAVLARQHFMEVVGFVWTTFTVALAANGAATTTELLPSTL
jgi:hypothetical protein